jgi:deoxycytidine triphosphate deaminase
MPKIIPASQIKEAITQRDFIIDGKLDNAEGIKYDFQLGSSLLKADYGQPIEMEKLSEVERAKLAIQPGEIVFVLTEETLNLPDNMYALLIPKRKMMHAGIMVLGGLSVDPLYKGKLLIGLYNLSSTKFPIIQGKKLLAAQFYTLEEDEKEQFRPASGAIHSFPDDLVTMMTKYQPISMQALEGQFKELESKLSALNKEFQDKDVWFEKFQEKLDRQESSIEKILKTIEKEVEDRQGEDKVLESHIEKTNNSIQELSALVHGQQGSQKVLVNLMYLFLFTIVAGIATAIIVKYIG